MLKANDLRERTLEDLRELQKTLSHDVFQNRFKNFTNRLDDTSTIKKAKRDLARVLTVLTERSKGLTPVAKAAKPAKAAADVASEPPTTEEAPKSKAKKAAAAAPKAAAKSAEKPAAAKPKKTAATKKSEAK